MGVLSITDNMSDMEYIIGCIEEHMFNFMTLLKICICRIKSNSLAEFLKDIKVDLIPGRYKTDEEKIAFLNYNNFSLKFVKITIVSCVVAATLYYLAGLAANIEMECFRLAESLESDFNILILQQLLGSTIHLCLLGYDGLVSMSAGQEAKLITFGVIAGCVLSTLLAYCYIGECLINESMSLAESFYQCEWYNISQEEIKLMHICMMRSAKQMQLTVGKFFALSLTTFTDVNRN
ncbi:odorant receptor coreceptor-like [Vespula pensylvanica]|uniref:odorant receptor coreceptor-like n=1 Tax=Vespula pensylvanica TaxID=30213 RepID=UPI001CBA4B6D|nr:odorant receptor coreceptor-like [Vespula pensylvanica]